MTFKFLLMIFTVLLPCLLVEHVSGERNLQSGHLSSLASVSTIHRVECGDDSDHVRNALHQLSSGEYQAIEEARRTLLDFAKKSSACRRAVIRALMDNMDQPNLNLERQLSNYYVWREGSQLLGELHAVEALDLLISHLDMTNGLHSASQVFQPAILGVRQMGPAAIPKLTVALLQSHKTSIRMAAAYCLTDIGGTSAMKALRKAQEVETDKCVTRFMHISLSTFSYKNKAGHVSFDNDAPQANAAARRTWLAAFECVE